MSEWTPPAADPARYERTRKCDWRMRFGWWCSRPYLHSGPCALRPKWWNVIGRWRSR